MINNKASPTFQLFILIPIYWEKHLFFFGQLLFDTLYCFNVSKYCQNIIVILRCCILFISFVYLQLSERKITLLLEWLNNDHHNL